MAHFLTFFTCTLCHLSFTFFRSEFPVNIILASVSFWPLLIIGSMACVSQHVLFMHSCLLSRYNIKGELDCFNCYAGVFPQIIHFHVYKRMQLQSTFCETKPPRLWGILNNYKEKLVLPECELLAV